jgi:hypothetical protein
MGARCEIQKLAKTPGLEVKRERNIDDVDWLTPEQCLSRACNIALEDRDGSDYRFQWTPGAGQSLSGIINHDCSAHPILDTRSRDDLEDYADGVGSSRVILNVIHPRSLVAVSVTSEDGAHSRLNWMVGAHVVFTERKPGAGAFDAIAAEMNAKLKAKPYSSAKLYRLKNSEIESLRHGKKPLFPFGIIGQRRGS